MYYEEVKKISLSAESKANLSKNSPFVYLGRSMFTGALLFMATILSYTVGAVLSANFPEAARISCAALFCFAIISIVFFNGELFTGNNMAMCVGMFEKKASFLDTLRVWVLSLLGNALGIIIFAFLFAKSGASMDVLAPYVEKIVTTKVNLDPLSILLRGILCNFCVCLAVYSGTKMKSDFGKIALMFFCVFTFCIAGFEHCIANIAIFSIGAFTMPGFSLIGACYNLIWAILGNIIGGGLVLGGTMKLINVEG